MADYEKPAHSAAKRRKCHYNASYSKEFPSLVKSTKGIEYVRCTICDVDLLITHGGRDDCKRHVPTNRHVEFADAKKNTTRLQQFGFVQVDTSLQDAVTRAECLFTSFLVEHNVALSAADHAGKLFKAMFCESKHSASEIIKQYACGRTKTTQIVNEMAAVSKEKLIDYMKTNPYSIATDGTNDRGTKEKVYPLVIRSAKGCTVTDELLAVLDLPGNGTGLNIANLLLDTLSSHNIPFENCVSLSVDNTNAMICNKTGLYGQLIKKNSKLQLMGCVCHRIHLAAQWGSKHIDSDVNALLVDIYYMYLEKSPLRLKALEIMQKEMGVKTLIAKKNMYQLDGCHLKNQ